tara:strand:- start:733 stop:1101 length:369 start_codon:yes stop_codon:yes gene_type:complete
MTLNLNHQLIKRVEKGWGYELWIVNNEKYCGKLLVIEKGKQTSWHHHKIKDEVMFIQSGKVEILYSNGSDINSAEKITLIKGQAFHIYTGLRHRITAIEDTELFEFSTQHFDSDSIRIIKGD